MVEISIISKKQQEKMYLSGTKSDLWNYSPIIMVAIVAAAVYFILLVQKAILKKDIEQSQTRFSQNEAIVKQSFGVSSYELSDRLSNLSQVLSSRLYWSNFLGRPNKIFNSDIIISSSKLNVKDFKVSFSGLAPSYDSLEKQLEDLKNNKDFVQDFSLLESSFSNNSIIFKIDVTFIRNILKGPYSL